MRKIMATDRYHVEVRDELAARGMSQRKFAKLAGVSQAYINLFAHGQRVGPQTRAKIENAMARLKNGGS